MLPDTVTWRGAHAEVSVIADALISGEAMRDILMHQVLETHSYPKLRFTLDSLVGMKRGADAIVGSAVGTLTIRGLLQPMVAAVRVFPDGGGMRVLAKWRVPSDTLVKKWIPKIRTYGLGANTNLWHDIFMGADLVFIADSAGQKK